MHSLTRFAPSLASTRWIQIAKGAKKLAKGQATLQRNANIFVYTFSSFTFLSVIGLVAIGLATLTPGIIIICALTVSPIYFVGGRGLSKAMQGNPNMKRVDDITKTVMSAGVVFSGAAILSTCG